MSPNFYKAQPSTPALAYCLGPGESPTPSEKLPLVGRQSETLAPALLISTSCVSRELNYPGDEWLSLMRLVQTLPSRMAGPGRGPASKPGNLLIAGNLLRMHIVICSKSLLIVDAAALAFQARQPRLTVCESGLEVLGAVEVVDADLLIMDMQTPGLDGLLIISAIRELAPSLPILALSARPEQDARAFSHKGVSFARLPSGPSGDVRALMAALAQVGQMGGVELSSDAGLR